MRTPLGVCMTPIFPSSIKGFNALVKSFSMRFIFSRLTIAISRLSLMRPKGSIKIGDCSVWVPAISPVGFILVFSLLSPSVTWSGAKADMSELERASYFFSLMLELAYITTKKAKSKVMKSAYETNQRSLLSWSSGRWRLFREGFLKEVSRQSILNDLGMFPIGNGCHRLD